jgi:hypothetical protein
MENIPNNFSLGAIISVIFYITLLIFVVASWTLIFGLMKYGKSKALNEVVVLIYGGIAVFLVVYGIIQLNRLN